MELVTCDLFQTEDGARVDATFDDSIPGGEQGKTKGERDDNTLFQTT